MSRPPSADSLDETFPGTTEALDAARVAAAMLATSWGERQDTTERIKLVVSELVTNAVQASPGKPYRLSMGRTADGDIAVQVTNIAGYDDLPPRADWGPADMLATRGRGLGIVEALSRDVRYREIDGHRLQVTAILPA